MLKRKQVYIDEQQEKRLQMAASKDPNLDVSKLIRLAINYYLDNMDRKFNWQNDSLLNAVGKVKGSSDDLSIHHDHYLYGMKKKLR